MKNLSLIKNIFLFSTIIYFSMPLKANYSQAPCLFGESYVASDFKGKKRTDVATISSRHELVLGDRNSKEQSQANSFDRERLQVMINHEFFKNRLAKDAKVDSSKPLNLEEVYKKLKSIYENGKIYKRMITFHNGYDTNFVVLTIAPNSNTNSEEGVIFPSGSSEEWGYNEIVAVVTKGQIKECKVYKRQESKTSKK